MKMVCLGNVDLLGTKQLPGKVVTMMRWLLKSPEWAVQESRV